MRGIRNPGHGPRPPQQLPERVGFGAGVLGLGEAGGIFIRCRPRPPVQGRTPFADEVGALAAPLEEGWVRDSLSWFPLLHDVPPWFIEDRVRDGLRMPARAWKAILNGLIEATPPTESGTIHAPTLILWGAQDNLLPRGEQEALAARIPGAVLKVYPDAAHAVLWECPERVAEDAVAFLRSLVDPRNPSDAL